MKIRAKAEPASDPALRQTISDSGETAKPVAPRTLGAPYLALIEKAKNTPSRNALCKKAAAAKAGIADSTMFRDIKAGIFVPSFRRSAHGSAWLDVEIDALLGARILMSRTGEDVDLKIFVALLIAT